MNINCNGQKHTMVIVLIFVLLASCPGWTRTPKKMAKQVQDNPSHALPKLVLPDIYRVPASTVGRSASRFTTGKQIASPEPWTMVRESMHQTPIFMEFDGTQSVAKRGLAIAPAAELNDFINEHAALFRLHDPATELVHRTTQSDQTGRKHVHLEPHYLGVPIWGASIVGHWSETQGLYAINGRYCPSPAYITEVKPLITSQLAIDRALNNLMQQTRIEHLSAATRRLLKYNGPQAKLYLWSARLAEPVRLTWNVEIRPNLYERWHYFIDANSGQLLDYYQASPTDGPVIGNGVNLQNKQVDLHTLEDNGLFYLIDGSRDSFDPDDYDIADPEGALRTLDARFTDVDSLENITSTNNVFEDVIAVAAHENMEYVYEYFLANHDRRGIDGNGSSMISVVHVTEEDKSSMENAYWNGVFMAYGDGGDALGPLAGALDVAAHEMTHGIIERTVNLEYRLQSGALNESFADIFAVMVDDDDWLLGEDIVNSDYFPSGALRDIQDPHNGDESGGWNWQPAHMDEYQHMDEDDDNGGVHVNSGIPNRAAYLVAEAIGRQKMAQIYYHILAASYLTTRSQFIDCRLAAVRAARDLFGSDSSEVDAVLHAYDTVGITNDLVVPTETSEIAEAPELSGLGEHWVVTVAAELNGDNSLWMVKPTADIDDEDTWESITQLTTTQVYTGTGNAITAPVNGDFLFFIDYDNNLRYIDTDGNNESVVNDDGDWGSIALSPDGNRLVATTVYEDSLIYYLDLENSENSRSIHLYQWTTQDGIAQPIARYADALQWDASGTYVIYDVFNSLPGPEGESIDFWTVNVLDPIGDVMWSLFPPQPKGVHIGNPSLSSNILADGTIEDCRLLYERVDSLEERIDISVVDLCTGQEGVLYTVDSSDFLFPGFLNGDREIVFEQQDIIDDVNTAHLWRLPLTDNGFSSSGVPFFFVPNSQYPRSVIINSEDSIQPTSVEAELSIPQRAALAQNHPNPFNATTVISYAVASTSRVILDIFNLQGQRVVSIDQGMQSAGVYALHWGGNDTSGQPLASGVYFYRLRLPEGKQQVNLRTRKMLLLR